MRINVTKTFLPPIEEYTAILKRAWDKAWMTNNGELLLELERKLKERLEVSNIIVTTNGTLPLQIAVKLFGDGSEIITTPFSYVATTAAIVWENCVPVFVDIHPDYFTIDESKIEAAITPKTKAILATHVFGNPCHVEEIERIAAKYDLKVIYDAAHCFGVRYNDKSIFEYGDISTCSFHATKLFHTGEGGAMFTKSKELHQKLFYSHNFGHSSPTTFYGLGINAKTSELQAAMGLAVLPYIETIIGQRKNAVALYDEMLDFSTLRKMQLRPGTEWNYSYYPVLFESEDELLTALKALNEKQINPRRYFYPSLNTIEYTKGKHMPVSEDIASRILCLPLYAGLEEEDISQICAIVNQHSKTLIKSH
jgi:dTDP-4-amino-4,6-dideoxygalactose transaminase